MRCKAKEKRNRKIRRKYAIYKLLEKKMKLMEKRTKKLVSKKQEK